MPPAQTARLLIASLSVLASLALPQPAQAAGDRYRLEMIVFRNVGVAATPVDIALPRRFGEAFELDAPGMPEDPVRLDKEDGTFANIWNRLDRLAEYEPLLRLTYEQSTFEFHPPVRVHNEEMLAEVVLPDPWAAIEAMNDPIPDPQDDDVQTLATRSATPQPLNPGVEDAGPGEASEPPPLASYFRLDGTVQLRRSRFIHVDVDLEYRLDGPAWQREFGLPPGFEWIGEAPRETAAQPAEPTPSSPAPINALQPMTAAGPVPTNEVSTNEPGLAESAPAPEPFQVHRLQQSRQIRTDTLQYFDSAFLGAIVRVSEIADEDT